MLSRNTSLQKETTFYSIKQSTQFSSQSEAFTVYLILRSNLVLLEPKLKILRKVERLHVLIKYKKDTAAMTKNRELAESSLSPLIIAIVFQPAKSSFRT